MKQETSNPASLQVDQAKAKPSSTVTPRVVICFVVGELFLGSATNVMARAFLSVGRP